MPILYTLDWRMNAETEYSDKKNKRRTKLEDENIVLKNSVVHYVRTASLSPVVLAVDLSKPSVVHGCPHLTHLFLQLTKLSLKHVLTQDKTKLNNNNNNNSKKRTQF